jgi:tRNA-modifying protein YgfZ
MEAMIIGAMQPTPPLDGIVRLAHLSPIRASGADAARFLQGQLTSDVLALSPSQARWAGFCSAKGRLQASFLAWRPAADEFVLACAADLLAVTLKRLAMFVLRAQCRLADAGDEIVLNGLVGQAAQRLAASSMGPLERRVLDDGATLIRLPDAASTTRALWVGTGSAAAPSSPALALGTWRWLEVMSGVPLIEAATFDRFVPQMLNFDVVGGVDFHKGCYPGQEVVARSQYRGTIKRRMFIFDVEAPARPGDEVFHDADPSQPAGMVVNAAPSPAGACAALVEVQLAALDAGVFHLRSASGPMLRFAGLPYPLPAAEQEPA